MGSSSCVRRTCETKSEKNENNRNVIIPRLLHGCGADELTDAPWLIIIIIVMDNNNSPVVRNRRDDLAEEYVRCWCNTRYVITIFSRRDSILTKLYNIIYIVVTAQLKSWASKRSQWSVWDYECMPMHEIVWFYRLRSINVHCTDHFHLWFFLEHVLTVDVVSVSLMR